MTCSSHATALLPCAAENNIHHDSGSEVGAAPLISHMYVCALEGTTRAAPANKRNATRTLQQERVLITKEQRDGKGQ